MILYRNTLPASIGKTQHVHPHESPISNGVRRRRLRCLPGFLLGVRPCPLTTLVHDLRRGGCAENRSPAGSLEVGVTPSTLLCFFRRWRRFSQTDRVRDSRFPTSLKAKPRILARANREGPCIVGRGAAFFGARAYLTLTFRNGQDRTFLHLDAANMLRARGLTASMCCAGFQLSRSADTPVWFPHTRPGTLAELPDVSQGP